MDLQALRGVNLFQNLDPVQLAHLASIMQERTVPRGEIIFREGDAPEFFYVLKSGRVRISKVIPGMGEEALAILSPGAYFGEMELIDASQPRVAQAVAHEECVLQLFSVGDFHAVLNTDRELALAILWSFARTLVARLREVDDKVAATFAMAQFQ